MTDDEWRDSKDPQVMLDWVRHAPDIMYYPGSALPPRCPYTATDRKLRLYAVALCRLMEHLLPEVTRGSMGVAEMFADQKMDRQMLEMAWQDAYFLRNTPEDSRQCHYAMLIAGWVCANPIDIFYYPNYRHWPERAGVCLETQADLCREIFGFPNKPRRNLVDLWSAAVRDDGSWDDFGGKAAAERLLNLYRYDDRRISKLAQAFYDGNDAARYALIDTATELGENWIAEHFFTPFHPKGCWVIDWILGKT